MLLLEIRHEGTSSIRFAAHRSNAILLDGQDDLAAILQINRVNVYFLLPIDRAPSQLQGPQDSIGNCRLGRDVITSQFRSVLQGNHDLLRRQPAPRSITSRTWSMPSFSAGAVGDSSGVTAAFEDGLVAIRSMLRGVSRPCVKIPQSKRQDQARGMQHRTGTEPVAVDVSPTSAGVRNRRSRCVLDGRELFPPGLSLEERHRTTPPAPWLIIQGSDKILYSAGESAPSTRRSKRGWLSVFSRMCS